MDMINNMENQVNNQADEAKAHVCFYTDKVCLNCRKFDPNYHNGYCDYHKVDTSPSNSCSDFWEK